MAEHDTQDFSPPPSETQTMQDTEPVENQPFDEAVDLTDESSVSDERDSLPDFDGGGMGPGGNDEFGDSLMVTNQSYDEAMDVSDATSVTPNATGEHTGHLGGGDVDDDSSDDSSGGRISPPGAGTFKDDSDLESSDSEGMDGHDGMDSQMDQGGEQVFKPIEGGYDPEEFADIDASHEAKELFMYITRYKPQQIELESVLKPFIPEFIPAVGDIDAFLRVPRPDGKDEDLGLRVLDEPALHQTERTVLEMQLRAFTKQSGLTAQTVASIENAQSNPAAIKKWVESVEELHRNKPPTGMTFSKTMPDIEALMQVWPQQFEDMLGSVPLPPPELDVSVEEYGRVCCALLDIPVHDNLIHSLHQMCVLYSEFRGNQHFGGNGDGVMMGAPGMS
eukprot:TRINITY_DN9389_c0_g4_i5.p1 TRINITY_DN9389_c0_g4~~TRINITY_DN9389_c0_g4_i5.p1  ORF type:complete len:391 (-),score=102.43 TRINITY_DN9389_c0_g4_i5:338-1510(-)